LLTSFYTAQPVISDYEDGRTEKDGGTLSLMARKNTEREIDFDSKKKEREYKA